MRQRVVDFFNRHQTLRYLLVGGISVAAFFILFTVLTEMGVWYMFSAFIAWIVYYTLNFTLHKFWTFNNKDLEKMHRQLGQHLTLALTNLSLNGLMLIVLVEWLGFWYLAAQIFCTIVLTIVNFIFSRRIFA